MGLDHGPPNFCQKVWFLIMGTMVIIPIWVLIMYPVCSKLGNSMLKCSPKFVTQRYRHEVYLFGNHKPSSFGPWKPRERGSPVCPLYSLVKVGGFIVFT